MRKLICLILVLALFPVLPALAESADEAAVPTPTLTPEE